MPAIINAEWLDTNARRKYPLSEEATAKDATGSFKLPDDFLVDMVIPVHATLNLDPSKFHILQVAVFGTGVNLTIGYDGSIIATVAIPLAGFVRNTTFFIQGIGDFTDVLGKCTIGSLTTILASGGVYNFTLTGGRLEATVVVPDIRGLTGVRVKTGDTYSSLIQGDIAFEAGENVRIDVGTVGVVSVLRFSAIDGENTIADCACDAGVAARPSIKTINDVAPDADGNIELTGDDCLKVTPSPDDVPAELQPYTVALTDECSKPCCGCPELEQLVDDQQRVRDEINTLIGVANRLDAAIQAMQAIVAASA